MLSFLLVFLPLALATEAHSLKNVLDNENLQFIFLGGKGGVGKTTVSSAFAIQLAFKRKNVGPVLLISTDPAHSLSDAFKQEFNGVPQPAQGTEGLFVMEIDPQTQLQDEIKTWSKMAKEGGFDFAKEIEKLQSWITSVPGIDEATALASVIKYIEDGKYSAIVFDTAPTGHTLKLLQFPEIMQAGLNQLSSWQSKLWDYYNMFKGLMGGGKDSDSKRLKGRMEKKLKAYKTGIEKVGKMLKSKDKTTFISVCIAESLSISETQRLLQQLDSHKIHSSHIVVNQLVTPPTQQLMDALPTLKPSPELGNALIQEITILSNLVHSRSSIQQKYLRQLRESQEGKGRFIVEIPLLGTEVTGPEKLTQFSRLLTASEHQEKSEL